MNHIAHLTLPYDKTVADLKILFSKLVPGSHIYYFKNFDTKQKNIVNADIAIGQLIKWSRCDSAGKPNPHAAICTECKGRAIIQDEKGKNHARVCGAKYALSGGKAVFNYIILDTCNLFSLEEELFDL